MALLGRTNVVEVCAENLDAIDIVLAVELFVDGVGTVISSTDGEEEDILVESLLEREGDGDATTFASQVGLDAKDVLEGLDSGR